MRRSRRSGSMGAVQGMARPETQVSERILIAGAGIGGLTAALALLRAGRDVAILEKVQAVGEVGAGISLGASASRGLYALGLREALEVIADRPQGVSAALHYQTGAVLGGAFKDRQWKAEDLGPTHVIHRADLFDLLLRAVLALAPDALHLGHEIEDFTQDADGVTVRFASGHLMRGAALIGCDGLRSTVRSRMLGPERPRFTGHVAYRFLVPMERAISYMTASPSGPYVGPGRSMMRYPIRHGAIVNCVAFVAEPTWTGEGWSHRCSVDELTALFTDWHPDVRGLASVAPPEATAKWALYDRDPIETWVDGRVALLGDAAHPMLPFLGLGAVMAIEDAVVLGRAFADDAPVADALERYEAARVDRAALMLLESRRQGQIFRDGPGGQRQATLTTHLERMRYDPSVVPL